MQAASEAPLRMPRHFKKPTSPELIGNVVDNVPWSFHRPIPLDINLKIAELAGEEMGENGELTPVVGMKGAVGSAAVSMASVSSSSQEMSSSSTTTSSSRVAKTSHSQKFLTSSEMKASTVKSDLSELKSSISEMKNLSSAAFGRSVRSSLEDLCGVGGGEDDGGGGPEPLVTFPPDSDTSPPIGSPLGSPLGSQIGSQIGSPLGSQIGSPLGSPNSDLTAASSNTSMKFEKRVHSASNTKVMMDGFSSERATANSAGLKRVQQGDVTYQETQKAAQRRARLEMGGITAEKQLNMMQEKKSVKSGEITQHETQNRSNSVMRVQTETYTTEKQASADERATVGLINQEKISQSSQFQKSFGMTKVVHQFNSQMNGQSASSKMIDEESGPRISLDDLEKLSAASTCQEVEMARKKYTEQLALAVKTVRTAKGDQCRKIPGILNKMDLMVRKAWEVPTHGHELGSALCNALRTNGGLDFLLTCTNNDEQQFAGAKLLEQCLTSENRDYVVANGLEMVVTSACMCTKNSHSVEHSRVGTGILEHLFKHSEQTCGEVIKLGGLDSVLFECRKNDIETLRHCASALANLSLYGGADNHVQMIMKKVPMWLFPLAFHTDDNIKYYACLAIAALVANKEIEAAVIKSGTLDLVEPFITSHSPYDFANSNQAHAHGQSKHWLERLVPVLSSKREEARNLAAFHFCMEAGIKKQQSKEGIFREIGAIEPLKKVASCPNAIASKFAVQALRLIGEEIPHKLSQQVPLWSTEDVSEWVKQINFAEYAENFKDSRVDGDLLLQLTDDNLLKDIGINNGIKIKRFMRELQNLKKMADYSSRDSTNLNGFLSFVGHEFSIYTYAMLNAGVDRETLRYLSEEQLVKECGITNSIHRYRILDHIRAQENAFECYQENLDKNLDVFISYRRSNGSQLASLLKVHLQVKGFTVFIDVERLEAGKFDNNLLQSIKSAKHFILVLTPNALDRCIDDDECKDWVHREIVAALQAQCNIIPITDNFSWPAQEVLPDDMRAVCNFNGVMWIHDYQDACVEKLERFMKGGTASSVSGATPGTPSIGHKPAFNRNHSTISADGSDGSRE